MEREALNDAMIHTSACDVLGVAYPIVQAGMARSNTGADLVAAVSAAGGLGVLGCLDRPPGEAVAEIRRIRVLRAACLAERVPVFSFFRGDPEDAVARAHAAGAVTIHQVTTVAEAARACAVGVDVLVAQGREAGGHMGPLPLHSLLPAVVAVAGDRPVLAAGGIVDGRGLAEALRLGAAGVLMGTRFLATPEAPIHPAYKQAIVDATPGATVASPIFDIIWGEEWPGVQARGLQNRLTATWVGREDELRARRAEVLARLQRAEAAADTQHMILLAGEGAGAIRDVRPAGQVVRDVVAEAARLLARPADGAASA
jgi:NAD(P)H-dependent flavin oxidoreductase YrpB (nitropropane dioxygenase family)